MDELLNQKISVTYEQTEDGMLFVGRVESYPDVMTLSEFPGETYWLVVDAIRTLSSRNPE